MDERQFEQPDDPPPGSGDDLATGGRESAAPAAPPERPSAESLEQLVQDLTAAARAQAAVVAIETAALVDAVAALRPLEGHYGMTFRQWVAWQCGLTTAEARRVCLLAEKLPTLPLLDAAFRRGELSDGVTEKVARVATPANEHAVLAATEAATGAQLEQIVRDFRTVRAGSEPPPGASVGDPATMPSQASWGWDDRGRYRGRWNLRADDGAILEAALEAALAHFRATEDDIDATEQADADADVGDSDDRHVDDGESAPNRDTEPASRAAAPAPRSSGPEIAEGELRPDEKATTRRTDALIAFANLILAGRADDDGLLPESTQVILHHNLTPAGQLDPSGSLLPDLRPTKVVDATGDHADAPAPEVVDPRHSLAGASIPGCGPIPDWLAQKLACDSLQITVVMIAGFPISVPTVKRSFNRTQRRALRARDRHCRFPGCARTRHLHAHHTRPWHATQRTTVADAVLLCNQHHTLVHLRGLRIALGVDHSVTVTRPDGSILRGSALPPPDAATLAARPRPPAPPPGTRRTGTKEPLTHYARDTLATSWHQADGAGTADDPGPPPDIDAAA